MQRRRDAELFLTEHGRHEKNEKNEKISFLLWIPCSVKNNSVSLRFNLLISLIMTI